MILASANTGGNEMRALILGGALVLAACAPDAPEEAEEAAATESVDSDSALVDTPSFWSVEESVDPMTDKPVAKATARYTGDNFDIEAEISCTNGNLVYEFSSFDKKGEGADMRGTGGSVPYAIRVDKGDAETRMDLAPAYTNQVRMQSARYWDDDIIRRAANASRLVMRFSMRSGVETVIVDQTDADLQRVLSPCATELQREYEERVEARNEREQDEVENSLKEDVISSSGNQVWQMNMAPDGGETTNGM